MQILVLGKSQCNMHVGPYFCQSLLKGGHIGNCSLPPHTWKRQEETNEHALMPWIDYLMHGIIQSHLQSSEGPELCSRVDCFFAFCPFCNLLLRSSKILFLTALGLQDHSVFRKTDWPKLCYLGFNCFQNYHLHQMLDPRLLGGEHLQWEQCSKEISFKSKVDKIIVT